MHVRVVGSDLQGTDFADRSTQRRCIKVCVERSALTRAVGTVVEC